MKNNGIKQETWNEFLKFKKEVETMLDKKIDNNYLLNLLIVEGRLITNGKTLELKTEKVKTSFSILKYDGNENKFGDSDI